MFADPFIFSAIYTWLFPFESSEYINKIDGDNKILYAALVEATVVTHYRRFYPTYYIKAEAEVDVAYVKKNKFWPIEIKWANQIRLKDLKQIMKYPNAKILTKNSVMGDINGVPTEPLPLALWNLDELVKT